MMLNQTPKIIPLIKKEILISLFSLIDRKYSKIRYIPILGMNVRGATAKFISTIEKYANPQKEERMLIPIQIMKYLDVCSLQRDVFLFFLPIIKSVKTIRVAIADREKILPPITNARRADVPPRPNEKYAISISLDVVEQGNIFEDICEGDIASI
ncbi:MAG: hypothetical protein K2M69_07055 [Muribaculaceae bacterium]|nr:hypothetical protein [Muribaculaceae bacterium]